MQNWTDEMIAEFRTRRGYDPDAVSARADRPRGGQRGRQRPFPVGLPPHARRHVRRQPLRRPWPTCSARRASASTARRRASRWRSSRTRCSTRARWTFPWASSGCATLHPRLACTTPDVRGAASAAHVYGKPLVAAESFTGGGYESPYTLKKVGDYWLAQGINRMVFHTSAHQPLDTKPGNTMVGTHLNRNITWAEQARAVHDLSRAHARTCCSRGCSSPTWPTSCTKARPSSQPFWGAGLQPAPPEGYDYDYINTDVLLNRMSVGADGRLVLPDGMSYRVLVLPADRSHDAAGAAEDPRTGRRRRDGGRPEAGEIAEPGRLSRTPTTKSASLAAEVWGDLDGVSRTKRYVRQGPRRLGPAAGRRAGR